MSITRQTVKQRRKESQSGTATTDSRKNELSPSEALRELRRITGLSVPEFCYQIGITPSEFRDFTRKSRPRKIGREIARRVFTQFGFREEYLVPTLTSSLPRPPLTQYLASFRDKYPQLKDVKSTAYKGGASASSVHVKMMIQDFNTLLDAAAMRHPERNECIGAFCVAMEQVFCEFAERFGLLQKIAFVNASQQRRDLGFKIGMPHADWGKSPSWFKKVHGYDGSEHSKHLGSSAPVMVSQFAAALPFISRKWSVYEAAVSSPDCYERCHDPESGRTMVMRLPVEAADTCVKPP